jgi:hypothetical protein
MWIVNIMVGVRCMEKDAVAFSCSSGFPFRALLDMAMLTFPSCLLLTLSG